jgi:hypothetical protein
VTARDDALRADLRALADECASSGCIHLNDMYGRLRAVLDAHEPAEPEVATGVELHCDDCQQPYDVWFADNAVWNYVMSGGQTIEPEWPGMLCPRCFTLRATKVYETQPIWRLTLAAPHSGVANSNQSSDEDRDALAVEIGCPYHGPDYGVCAECSAVAEAVLDSAWLIRHDARVIRREGAR